MTTDRPKHIAIIMDGNGRWAERRSRPRIYGHIRGCARVRDIIREADKQGVKALTLYAFSTENWGRPTMSKGNTGLQLTIAVSYSGREELVRASRRLASKVASGEIRAADIDEARFGAELYTSEIGDPDLLIRTSGEQRISNFLLWQMAYSELYFTDTMWPDFKPSDLRVAIDAYARRTRRFGLTDKQAASAAHPDGV
ncbi:MAG: di-trans,poly-cis-decaprenylcistransferase [Deltaproteobacteria bacterium]|nr:di-trans,poly-cis-decaprenylcistransferase [Deltaproteobacteria bacterium]